MNRQDRMSIAYIISMKNGIHSFIHREMLELEKKGFKISIFPTKYGKGLYSPHPSWKIHSYNPVLTTLKQPLHFIESPRKYLRLLWQAIARGSIIDFAIAYEFSKRMRKEGIERIHCHFGDHKFFIGCFCKQLLGIPLSVTIHAYELFNNPNPRMFKRALDICDEIVTVSEFNKEILSEKYAVPRGKVHTIRLFTDKGLDEEIIITKKGYIAVLIVSRFVEKKGHDVLFRAIKELNREDIRVWVVGKGPLDLEGLARKLGIANKVTFFGELPDDKLRVLYENCDIFCLPSRTSSQGDKEGIPVALMEAMAYGKPVISTRHAGIPELVEEVLIDENDWQSLMKEIARLADDPDLRLSMGKRNREIIERGYTRRNVSKLVDIFMGMHDETS